MGADDFFIMLTAPILSGCFCFPDNTLWKLLQIHYKARERPTALLMHDDESQQLSRESLSSEAGDTDEGMQSVSILQ